MHRSGSKKMKILVKASEKRRLTQKWQPINNLDPWGAIPFKCEALSVPEKGVQSFCKMLDHMSHASVFDMFEFNLEIRNLKEEAKDENDESGVSDIDE